MVIRGKANRNTQLVNESGQSECHSLNTTIKEAVQIPAFHCKKFCMLEALL